MTAALVLSGAAEADLSGALGWYGRIRPGLEADLALCVEEALDRILENPWAFPVALADVRRALVRRFPYSILFRASPVRVEVLGVFHARQDPGRWQGRIGQRPPRRA